MDSRNNYDVVIVGGGMVGAMLAALLAQHTDLKLAVLEQRQPAPFEPGSTPGYDIRVSALSIATKRMLESAGAWQGILSRRACEYREMLVWDGEESGRTHFKAEDIGAQALGYIVENRVVQLALLDSIVQNDKVDMYCPAHIKAIKPNSDYIEIGFSESAGDLNAQARNAAVAERSISTRLLIGADGAHSSVRELSGISMQRYAYDHHALVATVQTALPQQQITWQRFVPTGPQAFLPLCGSTASMVWYHSEEEVMRLKSLNDVDFINEMQIAFPQRLGGIEAVQNRASFPIVKAHADTYIGQRTALIGDAAHTVHPLAGQGVNLGMMDASAIAELIMEADSSGKDIGAHRLLRRYERWRRSDNAVMMSVLDGFYHAFKPQPSPIRRMRSAALSVADSAGPLKHFVMRYAMGTSNDVSRFARR